MLIKAWLQKTALTFFFAVVKYIHYILKVLTMEYLFYSLICLIATTLGAISGIGGGVIIKKYPERLRTVSVRDMYELKDVDSPEDLSELLER